MSLAEKSRIKKSSSPDKPVVDRDTSPISQRSSAVRQIRQVVGLETNQNYYGSPPTWYPKDFGQARMGCLAWLALLARNENQEAEYIEARRAAGEKAEKGTVAQSWLYYSRPLMDGDRIQYEFWYQTGSDAVHVHPALDHLAFLLDGDGVDLHWMTESSSETNRHGLSSDNSLVDPSIRKGPIKLNDI